MSDPIENPYSPPAAALEPQHAIQSVGQQTRTVSAFEVLCVIIARLAFRTGGAAFCCLIAICYHQDVFINWPNVIPLICIIVTTSIFTHFVGRLGAERQSWHAAFGSSMYFYGVALSLFAFAARWIP